MELIWEGLSGRWWWGVPETDPNTDHTLLLLIHMAMSGTTEALSLGSEGVFSFLLPGEA